MNRGVACLIALFASVAAAENVRLLLSIGSDIGAPSESVLRYAAADARRVVDVFTELGQVDPQRAVLLQNPTDIQVREALFELSGRAAELRVAGHTVSIVVYVSGHAKAGMLHLKGTTMPLADVRSITARGRSQLTVLIVDACDSGAIARLKGGKPGVDFNVSVESSAFTGTVAITSSGPQESSEEWDSLRGSLFTHHLLNGLRGNADQNKDHRVSLMEAYSYAFQLTTTVSATGGQHPALDVDIVGAGEIVLTDLVRGQATLIFPAAMEGQFRVVRLPHSDLLFEVNKLAGAETSLAVPRGRFQVSRRTGTTVAVTEVDLPFGGTGVVDAKRFSVHHFAEVSLKGGTLALRQHWLGPSVGLETEPLQGTGVRWNAGLAYRFAHEQWVFFSTAHYGYAAYRAVQLTTFEHDVGLRVAAGYRFVTQYVMPVVALTADGTVRHQAYLRDLESDIQGIGFRPLAPQVSLGLTGGVLLGVEIPLPAWLQAFPWITGQVRIPVASGQAWSVAGAMGLALGARF